MFSGHLRFLYLKYATGLLLTRFVHVRNNSSRGLQSVKLAPQSRATRRCDGPLTNIAGDAPRRPLIFYSPDRSSTVSLRTCRCRPLFPPRFPSRVAFIIHNRHFPVAHDDTSRNDEKAAVNNLSLKYARVSDCVPDSRQAHIWTVL